MNKLERASVFLTSAFCIAMVLLLMVYSFVRLPWYDEICMIDPAYSWAFHGKLATHALDSPQPYAWNYPLFIYLLSLGIHVVGLSFVVFRSFVFIASLGFGCLVIKVLRCQKIFSGSVGALALTSLLLSSTFMRNMSTNIRPESVTSLVFLALVVVGLSKRGGAIGNLMALLISAIVPWCGIHMIIPVGVAAVLALFFYWSRISKTKVICILAGLVVGSALLLAFYKLTGSMDSFVFEAQRVVGDESIFARILRKSLVLATGKWEAFIGEFTQHAKLTFLFFFFIFGYRLIRRNFTLGEKRNWAFVAVVSVAIPMALHVFTNLMPWYEYIYILPMFIALASYAGNAIQGNQTERVVISFSMAIFLLVSGAGAARVVLRAVDESRSTRIPDAGVFPVSNEDVVVTPFALYFNVRPIAGDWYPSFQWSSPPEDVVRNITAVIASGDKVPDWVGDGFQPVQQRENWRMYRRPTGYAEDQD